MCKDKNGAPCPDGQPCPDKEKEQPRAWGRAQSSRNKTFIQRVRGLFSTPVGAGESWVDTVDTENGSSARGARGKIVEPHELLNARKRLASLIYLREKKMLEEGQLSINAVDMDGGRSLFLSHPQTRVRVAFLDSGGKELASGHIPAIPFGRGVVDVPLGTSSINLSFFGKSIPIPWTYGSK